MGVWSLLGLSKGLQVWQGTSFGGLTGFTFKGPVNREFTLHPIHRTKRSGAHSHTAGGGGGGLPLWPRLKMLLSFRPETPQRFCMNRHIVTCRNRPPDMAVRRQRKEEQKERLPGRHVFCSELRCQ